jgi:hypothetical protein
VSKNAYEDQVRAASAALVRGENANWELACLTYENTFEKGDVSGQQKVSMERWCADIRAMSNRRFSKSTGMTYKAIWKIYGHQQAGDRKSWTEAYAEVQGGTMADRMVEADFKRAIEHASPEQKREAIATLAQEPEVLADDETRWAVKSAALKAERLAHPGWFQDPPFVRTEPNDSTLDRRKFFADIAHKLDEWSAELEGIHEFLDWSGDVDQQRRWATRQAFERLINAATACRDVLPDTYVPEPV